MILDDNSLSTIQRHDGTKVVPLPMDQRPGLMQPTPENLQRVADEAAAKRARTASEITPMEFGRQHGISRDLALFLQRLEGRVIDLERENKELKRLIFQPAPHMQAVERRG